MSPGDDLLQEFYALFGNHGGDCLPGNVGPSRSAVNVCQELLKTDEPILFEYFKEWDDRPEDTLRPFGIEQFLVVQRGQWEGAWALAQLHYDQLLKREAKDSTRKHKGHPLCNLALLGRAIGSPSLTRHYAMLSSAGDVYWEHEDSDLKFGGYAPTVLERFESHERHYLWRKRVRDQLAVLDGGPVYLESLLASRWFTETYAKHITGLAKIESGKPFTDVLLESLESTSGVSDTTRGTRFEAAAGLLLSATPGFEVDSGRRTDDEQVDLVAYYMPEQWAPIGLEQGCGLIECKSSTGAVTAKDLRDFGAKCLFHRVRFGILIARAGTTGGSGKFAEPRNAELVRRRFQLDGLTILVLDIEELRGKTRELRGLHDALAADYRELAFGPMA